MENFYKYLFYVADIVWILPAFRQYKTKYFYFFLMISLINPVGYFTYFFVTPSMYFTNITLMYFSFLACLELRILKRSWIYFLILYLVIILLYLSTDNWINHAVLLIIVIIGVIFVIMHNLISELLNKKFSYFIITIICYLFIEIFKLLLIVLIDFELIQNYVYFTNGVEILLGIFFIIFRADDDRLSVKL